ncbi:hypothetical protein AAY473_034637 [Plecturocebus cupreus]
MGGSADSTDISDVPKFTVVPFKEVGVIEVHTLHVSCVNTKQGSWWEGKEDLSAGLLQTLDHSENMPSLSYADLAQPAFACLQNMGIRKFLCCLDKGDRFCFITLF